jgi:hypothetical protein
MAIDPARFISEYLISRTSDDLCDACLTKHTGLAHSVVLEQVTMLARTPLYLRDVWECTDCGNRCAVTRALANRA